jgi:hypothetical protein
MLARDLHQYGIAVESWARGFFSFSTTVNEVIQRVPNISPNFRLDGNGFRLEIQLADNATVQAQRK